MEEAALALRKAVVDNFASLGVPGDLTPVIMEQYDKEVLNEVQKFDEEFIKFVKKNEKNQQDAVEMKSNLAGVVGKMSSSVIFRRKKNGFTRFLTKTVCSTGQNC